ncbi:P-loop containing nucleoside triphosphate hydrolase protein [Basidiobolus meristosporus CBS 931.73]|uniref:p-loop containing nucleoside triphosphate hydrolase protein n=1 Tax=Basidiobolus meristosporus CBS 931.73 TaxID=1314790 RepID=A0A1Y1YFA4_9FUNG|nr:P-loop containing nucleoside triphosphate hydrolase protein [Basidiobolus meristosporus CBS 931.73]|eukprot:ORX96692.1 P-loop containing nucleoside triphosphate hydrolase protein [Basidiobolus meristosporus CBS 931.73]
MPSPLSTHSSELPDETDSTHGWFIPLLGCLHSYRRATVCCGENRVKSVPYFSLYRFASGCDYFYILMAIICSIAVGIGQSLVALAYGNITIDLTSADAGPQVLRSVLLFIGIGLVILVTSYGQIYFWTLSAENQCKRIRERYFHAVLRQDMIWHEGGDSGLDDGSLGKNNSHSLATRLSADTQVIYDGMAEKVGLVISNSVTFLGGYVIGFTRGWHLALVLLSILPLMLVGCVVIAKYLSETSADGQDAYSAAGRIAEQAIASIRTVYAFNGEKRECEAYVKQLKIAYKSGVKKAIVSGIGFGFIMFLGFSPDSLAFWYGAKLILSREMTAQEVMTVFIGITVGAYALWEIAPNIGIFASAQGAAYRIFQIIERTPHIDISSCAGERPNNVKGHITLQDVTFTYPTRPEIPVLTNVNIEILPGQTVALVGHSGSGKSTIIELIQRLYDCTSGSITIDNLDLEAYNVRYLRDMIGVVSQEPVLFNVTIKENITLGIRRDQTPPTDEEIEEVCGITNAHDFIKMLPMKYDTVVGEKGIALSGGQKQRIAIARALIKKPHILLLDEATSALDTETERIVQEALERASAGRTTIVVAHRLSTVKNADCIYVLDKGVVLESGTHESLLAQQGSYADLVAKQQLKSGGIRQNIEPFQAMPSSVFLVSPTDSSPATTILKPASDYQSQRIPIGSETKSEGTKNTSIFIEKNESAGKAGAGGCRIQNALIFRVAKYMRSDSGLLLVGIVLSGASGTIFPLSARYFGQIWDLLTRPEVPNWSTSINYNALMTFVTAAAAGVTMGGSAAIFNCIGERMALRMRDLCFRAILGQEVGFFDQEDHSTGALSAHLATDAYQMHELVSQIFRTYVQSIVTVTISLALSFTNSWRIASVILSVLPFMVAAEYFEVSALEALDEGAQEAYECSARIASEAILNVKSLVSLAAEWQFEARYRAAIHASHQSVMRKVYWGSIGFALSQSIQYWIYAVGFYAGYRFVSAGSMQWGEVFTTMLYVIYMAMNLGQMAVQLPAMVKGKHSAKNILELLDKRTVIDAFADGISFHQDKPPLGALALESVRFHYPTRLDVDILRDINMRAEPEQTIALVGSSGCGKSTVIALLERWYDVDAGRVAVDGYDLRDLQLSSIRSHMALVGQEPILFDMSIEDNIRYGVSEDYHINHEMVVAAAQLSDIHQFISSLPDGYDTQVGDKGCQLSGGQKQRVAIARALIRNPKILLLDEATSALDSGSEKSVQDALDRARAGRTTIVISHRLSTIQDADLILVINNGQIVESGRHDELTALNGTYANLCLDQDLINYH